MSYEGHTQVICSNGHYFERDAYNKMKCFCQADDAWINEVDDTNCDSCGIIPMESLSKFLIQPEVQEQCSLGHTHVVLEATYRIPTVAEIKYLECTWDNVLGYIPLNLENKSEQS